MKKIYFTIIAVLFFGFAQAQNKISEQYKIRADKEFNLFKYNAAALLYLRADTNNVEVISQLGKTYTKLRYYIQAHYWMTKQAKFENQPAAFFLQYAENLANVQDYEASEKMYKKYLSLLPKDVRANNQVKSYSQLPLFRQDSINWTISYPSINTPMDEFSPVFFKRGLIFTSNRALKMGVNNVFGWTQTPFTDLFELQDTAALKFSEPQNYFFDNNDLIIKEYNDKLTPKTIHDNRVLGTIAYSAPLKNHQSVKDNAIIKPLDKEVLTIMHDGPMSFNRTQDFFFFNRNKANQTPADDNLDSYKIELFSGKYTGGRWHDISAFEHNHPDYSTAHPALTPDGETLYFVSDMPGGFGGKDIYYSIKSGDTWSKPTNLGPKINTEGDETFPYVAENNELFFSSNGHTGLGGLDLFKVKLLDRTPTGTITNLGFPVNSSKDDFGIIFDQKIKFGYFSSNRYGSDDIFKFDYHPIFVKLEGKVLVDENNTKMGINNALVILTHESGVDSTYTNQIGYYSFNLKVNTEYSVSAKKEAYISSADERVSTTGIIKSTTLQQDLVLALPKPIIVDSPLNNCELAKEELALENIFYDLDKFNIRQDAIPAMERLLNVLTKYPELELKIKSHTDSRASAEYNLRLSNNRAISVINWLAERGIDRSRMTAEYFGKRLLVNQCSDGVDCSEDVHQVNRRSEFYLFHKDKNLTIDCGIQIVSLPASSIPQPINLEDCKVAKIELSLNNIFYDLDKHHIRADAIPTMTRLFEILVKYPKLTLQIKSHTDSRASAAYNLALSKRRAGAVVDWLAAKGIDKKRISTAYFGKRLLVNDCGDNVDCSEHDHQLNRRSEFYLFQNKVNLTERCN